VATGLPTAAG